MVDETNIETKTDAAVEAVAAKAEQAVAKTTADVKSATAKVAKAPTKAKRTVAKRRARKAKVAVVAAAKKNNKRAATSARRASKAAAAAAAPMIERTERMTNDFTQLFAGFQLPGTDRFQNLFADAGSRGQELAAKSQKAAEGFADLAKGNVEAMVEAGRIALTGAKSIGQDAIASSRDGLEQAAQSMKTLSDAESPTEFFQLQSEIARASFDRMVAESSKLTEQFVKLAGEAVQPLSNRASLNAERVNELMA